MNRMLSLTASFLAISGCMSQSSANDTGAIRPLASLSQCGLTAPGLVLVQSASDWRKLSKSLGAPLPEWHGGADRWLLVAGLGTKNTAGYAVAYSEANLDAGEWFVSVDVYTPAEDALVAQMLTTPCLVLDIPATGWDRLTISGEAPFPMSRSHP